MIRAISKQFPKRAGVRWDTRSVSGATASSSKEASPLLVDEQDGVLTLTLNRPQQRNALNRYLLELLQEQLLRAKEQENDNNNTIRAVVLQSQGPVFSSGHDLNELRSMTSKEHEELFALSSSVMHGLSSTTSTSAGIPQPTIAAVQGLATAAGCQLALSCDLVVASPLAGFSTPGASHVGLFCHTPGVALTQAGVGPKLALDMLLTGRTLLADEAMAQGMVSRVAGNPQKEAAKLAVQVASQAPVAVQLGKRVYYEQRKYDQQQALQVASRAMVENLQMESAQAGIDEFLQKNNKSKKEEGTKAEYVQWQEFGRQKNI